MFQDNRVEENVFDFGQSIFLPFPSQSSFRQTKFWISECAELCQGTPHNCFPHLILIVFNNSLFCMAIVHLLYLEVSEYKTHICSW